jgi:hypothetical protein
MRRSWAVKTYRVKIHNHTGERVDLSPVWLFGTGILWPRSTVLDAGLDHVAGVFRAVRLAHHLATSAVGPPRVSRLS